MGSINGTIKDVIDEMRADGRRDRPRNPRRLPAVPGRGAAPGARAGAQRRRHRKSARVGMGGPLASNVAIALRDARRPAGDAFGHRRPRRPADRRRPRCTGSSARRRCSPGRARISSISTSASSARELHRRGKTRRVGPAAEGILKRAREGAGREAGGADVMNEVRSSSSTRRARSRSAIGWSTSASATCRRASTARTR